MTGVRANRRNITMVLVIPTGRLGEIVNSPVRPSVLIRRSNRNWICRQRTGSSGTSVTISAT